jgi:hypothetical protein
MNPALAGLLILVAFLGVLLTLELTGKVDLGLRSLWSGGREVHAANTTPVVLSQQPLQPGDEVTVAGLWNPQQGTYNHTFVDRARVAERNYLARPEDVVGRVLRRPKAAGQAFVESDFLPPGSPPGITGLVPDDMKSLSIEVERIPDLGLLAFGDRFDLRRSVEVDDSARRMAKEILESRTRVSDTDRMRLSAIAQGSEPVLVAQAGVVLRPSRGERTRGERIVVAVHPDDLNRLIAAVDGGGEIYCSPRRKRADGAYERVEVIEVDPLAEYAWVLEISREVELIHGGESRFSSVPTPRADGDEVVRVEAAAKLPTDGK